MRHRKIVFTNKLTMQGISIARLRPVLTKMAFIAGLLYTIASSGAAGSKRFTDYECLAPIELNNFNYYLRAGNLQNAVRLQDIYTQTIVLNSRLIFEQIETKDYNDGRFIWAIADEELHTQRTIPLTRIGLDVYLYFIISQNYRPFASNVFENLILPGALIFSHPGGAIVISPDRRQLSVCVKVDEYRSFTARRNWIVVDPLTYTRAKVEAAAIEFINNPKIYAVLECEEFLSALDPLQRFK